MALQHLISIMIYNAALNNPMMSGLSLKKKKKKSYQVMPLFKPSGKVVCVQAVCKRVIAITLFCIVVTEMHRKGKLSP